jgi:hypothetical protein
MAEVVVGADQFLLGLDKAGWTRGRSEAGEPGQEKTGCVYFPYQLDENNLKN